MWACLSLLGEEDLGENRDKLGKRRDGGRPLDIR